MARECRVRRTCQLCGEDENQISAANETAEAQERTGVMALYFCNGVCGALISGLEGRYEDGHRIGVSEL